MTKLPDKLVEWIKNTKPVYKSQDLYDSTEFFTDTVKAGIWTVGAKAMAHHLLNSKADEKEVQVKRMTNAASTCSGLAVECDELKAQLAIVSEEFKESNILRIITNWKVFWMNQNQNDKADHDNYYNRAVSIDANMKHHLADMISKNILDKLKGGDGV